MICKRCKSFISLTGDLSGEAAVEGRHNGPADPGAASTPKRTCRRESTGQTRWKRMARNAPPNFIPAVRMTCQYSPCNASQNKIMLFLLGVAYHIRHDMIVAIEG